MVLTLYVSTFLRNTSKKCMLCANLSLNQFFLTQRRTDTMIVRIDSIMLVGLKLGCIPNISFLGSPRMGKKHFIQKREEDTKYV